MYTRRGYLVRRFCQEGAIGEVGRVFPEVPAGNLPGRGFALGPDNFAHALRYVESRGCCRGDDRLQLSLKSALHYHPASYESPSRTSSAENGRLNLLLPEPLGIVCYFLGNPKH